MKANKKPPAEKNTSLSYVIVALLLICSASFSTASINTTASTGKTAAASLDTLPKTHPSLLFSDITQTPGYRYRTREPWATWENYIHIARTSNMVSGAMDHLIFGTSEGLTYSKNALINFQRTPGDGRNVQRVYELNDVIFAYDLIQPEFTASEDKTVRDKIAELADQVYFDLNHYDSLTTIDNDIQCVDYHFKAYSLLGITGMLMDDYTGTALPHGSTPQKWLAAGTDYLFVSDPLHDRNGASLFSACVNSQGVDLVAGDYRGYYYPELMSLAQVYSHYYNRNMLDDYPIIKKWVVAPLQYYMPDKYDTNRASGGNVKYGDAMMWMNLLDSTNKTYMWKFYNDLMNDNTLPYSRTFGEINDYHPLTEVAYSIYGDFSSVGKATPVSTTRFTDSDYQIFRKDWTDQSSWLSFVTFRSEGTENRFMRHDDQLSFELYNKGDYVLADSGEVKYRATGYGPTSAKGHNDIMFTSPGNSNPTGIYKGIYGDLVTNSSLYYLTSGNIEYVEAGVNINQAENTNSKGEENGDVGATLANPMKWTRSILSPNKEYFIVFDHVENSVQRRIDTLFQLSSFKHDTTSDSHIGNVYGDLTVENTAVNWLGQSYNAEVNIKDASDLKWDTTSPYNQDLETEVYSIPKSALSVEKFWMRVGGFDYSSEVDHPLVRYKYDTSGNMNRITALNTRYQNSPVLAYSEITVTGGTGSALRITNGSTEDIAFLGQGQLLTADKLKTDALTGFVRSIGGSLTNIFLKEGSTLFYNGISRFNSSKDVAVSLQYTGSRIYGRIEGAGSYNIALRSSFTPTSLKYNGQSMQYTYSSGVIYATLSGAGDLEVSGEGSDVSIASSDIFFPSNVFQGTLGSISARVRNTGSQAVGSFTVKFYDGASLVGTATVSSLAAGAYTDKVVSWTPSTGGTRTITVVVDADGAIAETDEGDNQASATVYVGYPADLTVSSSNISFSDSQPTEYENISIYVDVSNKGGTDVSGVVVLCLDGPAATGKPVSSKNVLIPKNSAVRLTYTWMATPVATHGLYISIDPNNTVSESNKGNNIAFKNIYVYSRPDLFINPANITNIPATVYSGSPVTLRAKLYNLGESDSGVFTVRFSDGATLIGESTTSVSGKSSVNDEITWTPATSGNHNISVVLDPNNIVPEPLNTNNAASKNVNVNPSASTTTTSARSTTSTSSTTTTTQRGATTTTTTTRLSTTTTTTTTHGNTTTSSSIHATTTSTTMQPVTTNQSTTQGVSTTTTAPNSPAPTSFQCSMPGDYEPCGVVTLQELVNFLNAWVQDHAALGDVVKLINVCVKST